MLQISKDTIIAKILEAAPDAVPLFRSMGMNCLGCALAAGETLGEACASHGVDIDDFIVRLREYVKE